MDFEHSNNALEDIECDGIIFGSYEDEQSELYMKFASQIDDVSSFAGFKGKQEELLVLYKVDGIKAPRVIVAGLGKKSESNHEAVRKGVALAAKKLRAKGAQTIAVKALNDDAQSSAEGVVLGLYEFDELKSKDKDKFVSKVIFSGNESQQADWNNGVIIAESQNIARRLAEMPANIGTPTFFVEEAKKYFEGVDKVKLISHDVDWAKEKKMGSFLSVTYGSDQPAKFLELHYQGANPDDQPTILIGKGITFDSGGISIKGSDNMGLMRADCTGAAIVIASVLALAKLGVKQNVIGLTPLTENMPSGKASRPADVVVASNGKSIEIVSTDAEGRMILADALVYSETFNPRTVIDMATLTGSMMVALGEAYVGTYARSDELWNELQEAGNQTFERFWRMPLDEHYRKKLKSTLADMKHTGGRFGGSNIAAMFLGEFINLDRWAHLDIAGVMKSEKGPYTPDGIPAIPLRGIVQFVRNLS